MANLYRLIAYAVLGIAATWCLLMPLKAHAAFPATQSFTYGMEGAGYGFPSALAVATVFGNARDFSGLTITPAGNNTFCATWSNPVVGCQTIFASPGALSCPANSTLSGSSCTCTSPFTESNGSCINENEALCQALGGTETYASAPGNVAPGASSCNPTGCSITYAGTVIRVKNAQGQFVTEGAATFSGGTCVYESSTGSVPDSCPGGSSGEINGITTCVPYDPALNTIETVKGTSTEKTDSTGTTTTGKTTTTVCTAVGSCTTTTTTQTSVNGGAPTTTTETTEEPRDDFCTKSPNDPQCSDSSFSGSCTGGFACSGDAIQCAAAKQLHELNCTLNKTSDQSALFNAERSNATTPLSINGPSKSISQADFSSANSLGVSSCISDISITVMSSTILLPLSDICDELATLRLVLLACAWFIAYRIVAGSFGG